MVAKMDPNCDVDAEDAESKFRKTLRQIITLAPKIKCPHEQQIMHEWIDRLMQPPCSEEDVERRMEYSRYMVYQLKRGKLHTPFLESPCQGELKPLDEMLVSPDLSAGLTDEPCCPELCCPPEKGKKGAKKGPAEGGEGQDRASQQSGGKRLSLAQQRRRTSLSASVAKGASADDGCKVDPMEENRKRVMAIMDCLNFDELTLEAFVTQISPHTLDKGKTLMEVVTQEQIDYKHQIECIYRAKEEKISAELAREQAEIPHKYEVARQKMLSRAMAGLNYIKSVCPSFQYEKWQANADYLRDMFKVKQQEGNSKKSGSGAADSMAEWERKNLQMLHDVNYEAERLEEANADKEKQIQELVAQQTALEQDFSCKKAQLAKKVQDLESEKFGYCIANDERDRMIEHLLRTLQTLNATKAEMDDDPC
ncbi:uncharacterized protein LOC111064319 isoform X1 [Nilaparvata lugens]|uniref:uncharacterized protein LOC111064319 isoform X2 n=1 Tax=Nilaparvata lugens TaxID=108931 RepID=UPI000B9962BF|nr:uncharacterized protein LOC111064319 isoform X2 [Nilaparvata lugens]XP_039289652.1 uncharacterized protein LOC111064319 isoform X1 [Nilaparvata lugens]